MVENLYVLPVLLLSVVLHEVAHGLVALWCGDPTAKEMGRLTLNPIPHIDLVGSVIVPVFSLLSAGRVFIAWAKPVPVNPYNFRHLRRDDILVSIAGPLTNYIVAGFCTMALILLAWLGQILGTIPPLASDFMEYLWKMFFLGITQNLMLAVFNMIPIPPLDGSHVLASFLPGEVANQYRSVGFFGIFLILILMNVPLVNRMFFGIVSVLARPFELLIYFLT